MHWPWVSRAQVSHWKDLYNRQVDIGRIKDERIALLQERARLAEARWVPGSFPVPSPAPVPREPSLVNTVIKEQARGDAQLASYLGNYSSKLKRLGKTDEEIAQALTEWTTTEPLEQ